MKKIYFLKNTRNSSQSKDTVRKKSSFGEIIWFFEEKKYTTICNLLFIIQHMKLLPLLLLLAVLASCGAQTPDTETTQDPINEITVPADDELLDDMLNDMDEMDDMDTEMNNDQTSMNNEAIEVDSSYRNPAGAVDMVVAMEVRNGIIQTIEASATTWDVSGFSSALQSLVGSPVEEGETFYAAGSSIASEAFNNAVKAI